MNVRVLFTKYRS